MRKTRQVIAGLEDEEDHKSMNSGDCGIWKRKGSKFSTAPQGRRTKPHQDITVVQLDTHQMSSVLNYIMLNLSWCEPIKYTVIYFFQIEN